MSGLLLKVGALPLETQESLSRCGSCLHAELACLKLARHLRSQLASI